MASKEGMDVFGSGYPSGKSRRQGDGGSVAQVWSGTGRAPTGVLTDWLCFYL